MEVAEVNCRKTFEEENVGQKKLPVEAVLDKVAHQVILAKSPDDRPEGEALLVMCCDISITQGTEKALTAVPGFLAGQNATQAWQITD